SGTNTSFGEVANIIKSKFPNYPISTKRLPKFIAWLMAPSVGMTRKMAKLNIGYPWKANNSKSIQELGITYRPLKETVTEFFSQLIEAGVIEKK
ncbi:MAG: diaminohydroxyphosphoribosylaminopyrimidine deaminase, partial [Crocinitomicaceae bacterium]|nr:diaminohydroxyphosphoribosylaminopyrimidine deaminase [Crocinitomicaceae bacterium]